jgi:hypothetical protein
MSLLAPSIPRYRNPQLRRGLAALVEFLMERGYDNSVIRWSIYDHVAIHGTLAGSLIEPEDEADAEAVFVAALPEVPFDSEAWDHDEVFLDVAMLIEQTHPFPLPDEPDAPDASPFLAFPGIRPLAERMTLPPIAGGAPEPTAEDLADYARWSEDLDRRRASDDYLAGFNRERQDWTETPA